MIKSLILLFKTFWVNVFLLMIFTYQVINKIMSVIWIFHVSFLTINFTFMLLKIKNRISKTIFMQILANKKIFQKYKVLTSIFKILKIAKNLPYIQKKKLSIFLIITVLGQTLNLKTTAKNRLIILISLSKIIEY